MRAPSATADEGRWAALAIETDDGGAGLAVWKGEFDAAAHRARYRAYAE